MKSYEVEFQPFVDLSLYQALGKVGCYVVWDNKSEKCATYIGSGELLERVRKHSYDPKFEKPLNGYAAILPDKDTANMVEALLIDIGWEKVRGASHNRKMGPWSTLERHCLDHKILKFYVTGYDPFVCPSSKRALRERKKIEVFHDPDSGEVHWDSAHWRRR